MNIKIGDIVRTPDGDIGEVIRLDEPFATVRMDVFYTNWYPISRLKVEPKQLKIFE